MEEIKQIIDQKLDELHDKLAVYNKYKLPNGLMPDEIKFSPEYSELKKEWDVWFKKLQAYNKAEMKRRKANGTKHYIEVHGVKISRQQELFLASWIKKNNIAMNTLTPEQRTEVVNKFIAEKFPTTQK